MYGACRLKAKLQAACEDSADPDDSEEAEETE
jgi:hypothetical protein